jgi:hypothetical protein
MIVDDSSNDHISSLLSEEKAGKPRVKHDAPSSPKKYFRISSADGTFLAL